MPSKAELREKWNNAGKDVVVLHMFKRGRKTPNPSPYPLKVETYMRMAGIDYVTDDIQPLSAKGKSPWITFNGKDIADSQFCIEHLAKALNKDLSEHLSDEERAIARAMRAILEDNFYYCLVLQRWAYDGVKHLLDHVFADLPGPKFLRGVIGNKIKKDLMKQCEGQGIGRHTKEEVIKLGLSDLKAISDFLGKKSFLMGDKPTEIDCVLFGFSTQLVYTFPEGNEYAKALDNEYSNIKEHCLRMREKYWADWDDHLFQD